MTAFFLAKNYPLSTITWIYPEDNKTIGVGEALVPMVSHFLQDLGITHADIIKHCNGTLKMGLVFDGFDRPDQSFAFPFGLGEHDTFNTSSVMHMMKTHKVPDTIYQYPDISTHFRTTDMTKYMDTLVGSYSNLHIKRDTVTKDQLEGTYDLLIDCTGFGRYVSKLSDNFVDISDKVPNNKAFVYRHSYTSTDQVKPYSLFKAMDYGWIWHIPLGDQLAVGYVHCDKFDAKPQFIEYITQLFGLTETPTVGEVKYITGRNKVHMKDKVVAVGLASSFIEPLESTGLYFVVSALYKLQSYIDGCITEQEYNESVNRDFDVVVDFILAHYKYSKRDNEYWRLYKDTAIAEYEELDIFPKPAWDYILSGFGRADVPKESVNPTELINIHRGTPYHEWLANARNAP